MTIGYDIIRAMFESLKPNKTDVAVGVSAGLTYALIAPTNEAAIFLTPLVMVAIPYVGKCTHALYQTIKDWNPDYIDPGPDGYYGLKSDHAKGGIEQINLLEEEGFDNHKTAEKNRQKYAKAHRGH